MSRAHPEDDLQRDVAQLLDGLDWLWCHVPNGGRRGRVEAARLKGLGVKAGVPDILVFEPTDDGFGIAIELKAGRNQPTAEQLGWIRALSGRWWLSAVCRSLDEVMDVLRHVRPHNGRRMK